MTTATYTYDPDEVVLSGRLYSRTERVPGGSVLCVQRRGGEIEYHVGATSNRRDGFAAVPADLVSLILWYAPVDPSDEEIELLQMKAGAAGDTLQIALCVIAAGGTPNEHETAALVAEGWVRDGEPARETRARALRACGDAIAEANVHDADHFVATFYATHAIDTGAQGQGWILVHMVDGNAYTALEWANMAAADWSYDDEDGLLFQGQPVHDSQIRSFV